MAAFPPVVVRLAPNAVTMAGDELDKHARYGLRIKEIQIPSELRGKISVESVAIMNGLFVEQCDDTDGTPLLMPGGKVRVELKNLSDEPIEATINLVCSRHPLPDDFVYPFWAEEPFRPIH